jgi:hypothetical protein
MKKSVLVIAAVVCLAVIVAMLMTLFSVKPKTAPTAGTGSDQAKTENISVKSFAPTDDLPFLPEDFPIDERAQVTNNYSASSPQSDTAQYTRAYSSAQSLSALHKIYLGYFLKNNWTIQTQTLTTQNAAISAFKDRVAVIVTVQQLQSSRFVTISVGQSSTPFVIPNSSNDAKPSL